MSGTAPVCWAIVPVKAPGEGKSRLAGVLAAHERGALVAGMLRRVVGAALACPQIAQVCLVGPDDHGLGADVMLLADAGDGLNEALHAAVVQVLGSAEPLGDRALCPDRLIIVPADLPQVDARDLAMLASVDVDAISIAPDRHGTGTNALSLPSAAASAFRFQFGPGSYAAHRAEALRFGYTVDTMLSDGLEKDIDEPIDLPDAKDCRQGAL